MVYFKNHFAVICIQVSKHNGIKNILALYEKKAQKELGSRWSSDKKPPQASVSALTSLSVKCSNIPI